MQIKLRPIIAQSPLWCIRLLFFLPLILGVVWVFLPAFSYFPALNFTSFSLQPWHDLFAMPGLVHSISLTIFSGVLATILSCGIAVLITATYYTSGFYKSLQNILAPLLAIPHLTVAAGIAFLLAPSGFFFRIPATIFGWDTPPNLTLVPDNYGLILVLTLLLKEIPFFLFIINGALAQIAAPKYMILARSMGYHPFTAWFKVILPQIYTRIKLPILIVLIFSMSVVDIAIFVAPNAPPPFAVMLLHWFYDPDLSMRLVVAAGGIVLMCLIALIVILWLSAEKLLKPLWEYVLKAGKRGMRQHFSPFLSHIMLAMVAILAFGSLLVMVLWSFAITWRFPNILPTDFGVKNWVNCQLCGSLINSLLIACLTTVFALIVVIGLLEYTKKHKITPFWFYIPLLIPQVIFLFGFDLILLYLDAKGYWGVMWAHWLYVLPYVFLILYASYQNFDLRYEQTAYGLGVSRIKTMVRVKLPILFRPIIYAFAVGFAVSINEYLPTLLAGEGRISTLTTEMVALAAGGDRRVISVTSVFQAILPFSVFVIALILPNLQARRRRGLAV